MASIVLSSTPDSARPMTSSASVASCFERRRGFLGQIEAVGAPVGRVVTPLDQARDGQFVDQAAEGDRREVERLRQFALFYALAALQARKHRPLGPGCPGFTGALVGIGPEQARHVMERKAQLSRGRDHWFLSK